MIKLAACVLLLVAVASAVEEGYFVRIPKAKDHNYIRCDPDPVNQDNWKILDSRTVSKTGKFLQIVQETTSYPVAGFGKEVLTCIRVIDQIADGTGGYPDVEHGGVGFNYVTIRYVSQRSHGYEFAVEIWGMIQ